MQNMTAFDTKAALVYLVDGLHREVEGHELTHRAKASLRMKPF